VSKESLNYIPALTGVRAIAPGLVFIHHNPLDEKIFGTFLHKLSSELHFGVTLFFVLSGFLIAHRYYDAKIQFKTYFINRFARIYPMFFILTVATFAFYAITKGKHGMPELKELIANLTFIKGFFDDIKFTGIIQSWTLTVEEVFYMSAPVIFLLIKKWKYSIITIPISLILLGFGLVKLFENINIHGFMGSNNFMLLYTFFGRSFEFFIGIGLALFIKHNQALPKIKVTYFGILIIVLSANSFTLLKTEFVEYGLITPLGIIINNFLMPLFGITFLYYGLIKENTLVSRFLSTKSMVLCGQSSYIFYLIHMGFIDQLLNIAFPNIILRLILLILLSIVLFKFLEDPLNRLIRTHLKK
jgi:peptidoglycan/LPS O-acetylase OafA/YrhL